MIVKRIFVNGMSRSRGFEKRYVARSGSRCCVSGGLCCLSGGVRRRVSTRISFSESVWENRAQTSGLLYGAVCLVPGLHLNQQCSRARHTTRDDEDRRGGVKTILFSSDRRVSAVKRKNDGTSKAKWGQAFEKRIKKEELPSMGQLLCEWRRRELNPRPVNPQLKPLRAYFIV